ncbi:uncharacterized protein LOC116175583 [Photinus pyralis]|uniref:uncharacterized protein LOC116175583 n=1 Tax=Photinus pyralis TaxID=7054 RepID=UPI001266E68B|nr:uncharacterized protein LOC116175583 [Photinus pyralis]
MSVIRKARTSKKQYVIYVEYLEEHPILRSGKLSPRTTPEDLHNLWVQLVNALNACGDGPTRDVDAWKKVFTEWKSQTRKKAREGKVLNVLEERLLKVTGVIVVDGAPGVPELGVPDEVQQVMHTVQDLEIEYLDDQHIEPTIGSEAPNIEVASLVESENKAKDNQKKICRKKSMIIVSNT